MKIDVPDLFGDRMFGEPAGQFGFGDFSGRQAEEGKTRIFLPGGDRVSVVLEEYKSDLHRCSLVAVQEWMIAGDAYGISRGQICQSHIGLSVGKLVLRAG